MEKCQRNFDSSVALSRGDNHATWKRKKEARVKATLERIRRPYAEYKNANPRGNLCHRCASVNWSLLLPSEAWYHCPGDHNRLDLFDIPESSQELCASSCPLCQLLGSGHGQTLQVSCACYKLCRSHGRPQVTRQDDWTHHAPYLYAEGMSSRYMLQDMRATTQHYVLRKLAPELTDYEIL